MIGDSYKVKVLRRDTSYLLDGKWYEVAQESDGDGFFLNSVDNEHVHNIHRIKSLNDRCLYVTESGEMYIVDGGFVRYVGDRVHKSTPPSTFPVVGNGDTESIVKSTIAWCAKSDLACDTGTRNYEPVRPSTRGAFFTRKMIVPQRVHCSSPVTVAMWADGTKTMARASEGTVYDPFVGVAICVLKKAFSYVTPDDRSPNGEVGRLLKADHERRAAKYAKRYRQLFGGQTTCDPETVGELDAEAEEERWAEAPYTSGDGAEPSDG